MSKRHVSHPINSGKVSGRNAAGHEQFVQQETEGLREQVLTRLWAIASLEPERTRNSMSAQIKALSLIVAIEGLIPDRNKDRRAGSAQSQSAFTPVNPQSRTQGPGVSDPPPAAAAKAEATPPAPHAPVSASAPEIRVPSSSEKKPDTLRLRL